MNFDHLKPFLRESQTSESGMSSGLKSFNFVSCSLVSSGLKSFSLRSSSLVSKLLVLLFVVMAKGLSAQSFNIDPTVKDSLAAENYFYHVSGIGFFGPESILKVELFDENNQENILFTGTYSFQNAQANGITNFTYNSETKEFRFDIGNFPSTAMYLHMWIQEGEEVKNELFYK